MANWNTESYSKAIGVLTAWYHDESDDNPDLTATVLSYVGITPEQIPDDALDRALDLVVGLGSLAGGLLIRLERATRVSGNEILQDLAHRYGEGGTST